jgi:hypothetical protein
MSEIRQWLQGLGLPHYADAFEANDIDVDLLPQIDDQALKDTGVASTGHRLQIRAAIAARATAAPAARGTTHPALARQQTAPAERRPCPSTCSTSD